MREMCYWRVEKENVCGGEVAKTCVLIFKDTELSGFFCCDGKVGIFYNTKLMMKRYQVTNFYNLPNMRSNILLIHDICKKKIQKRHVFYIACLKNSIFKFPFAHQWDTFPRFKGLITHFKHESGQQKSPYRASLYTVLNQLPLQYKKNVLSLSQWHPKARPKASCKNTNSLRKYSN